MVLYCFINIGIDQHRYRTSLLSIAADLDRQCAGLGRGVALADLCPIHYVPPRFEVVSAAVLVGEVIGVLPHVIAEQYALAIHQRSVLIGLRLERELAIARAGDEHPA